MNEETIAIAFLAFGVVLTVLGFYYASRRRISLSMGKTEGRRSSMRLELREGPAVLAGVTVGLSGLWLSIRVLVPLLQGSDLSSISIGGPVILFILGLLAGAGWQIARNTINLLGSEEVKQKVIENIEGAIEAKEKEELSKPQKGIRPK